jgi:uncharacterized Tic20 family protein
MQTNVSELSVDLQPSARIWAVLLHLSAFAGFLLTIPFAPLLISWILWIGKKSEFPELGPVAREAVNFQISYSIYFFLFYVFLGVAYLLSFILIGIPLLILLAPVGLVLWVASLVFPVIGAMTVSEGRVYRYPFIFRIWKS